MAGFGSLEIAKRALTAQRYGLDVTSNNIANVNTPGYSRRQVVMAETSPQPTNSSFLGTGVVVQRIQTFREEFHDREIRNNMSRSSAFEMDSRTLQRIETALGEPSDYGIDSSLNKFYASFESLSNEPENIVRRQEVLNASRTLTETFNNVGTNLETLRTATKERLTGSVATVNQLLENITTLNREITVSRISDANSSSTLVDQRVQRLEELAKYTNITVNIDSNNIANVSIGGTNVVNDVRAQTLRAVELIDADTGERTQTIGVIDSQGNQTGTVQPSSGELGSLLKHYNVTLDDLDSSGGHSVFKDLNTLADTLVTRVNALSVTGYGLDDTGAVPPGRNFFTPAASGSAVTARSISISNDILGKPRDIPMAGAPGAPGNNEIARLISRTAQDTTFLNGLNPGQAYGSLLSKVASLGNEAVNGAKTTDLVFTQLNSQRESVIGVNLDEEAMNLIRFQKGFEAAARMVNVTNELLGTLINLGR